MSNFVNNDEEWIKRLGPLSITRSSAKIEPISGGIAYGYGLPPSRTIAEIIALIDTIEIPDYKADAGGLMRTLIFNEALKILGPDKADEALRFTNYNQVYALEIVGTENIKIALGIISEDQLNGLKIAIFYDPWFNKAIQPSGFMHNLYNQASTLMHNLYEHIQVEYESFIEHLQNNDESSDAVAELEGLPAQRELVGIDQGGPADNIE